MTVTAQFMPDEQSFLDGVLTLLHPDGLMREGVIVLFQPIMDYGLSLLCGPEPLGIRDFPSESAIEALIVAILPRATRIDLYRLDAGPCEPVLQGFGDKHGAIARCWSGSIPASCA